MCLRHVTTFVAGKLIERGVLVDDFGHFEKTQNAPCKANGLKSCKFPLRPDGQYPVFTHIDFFSVISRTLLPRTRHVRTTAKTGKPREHVYIGILDMTVVFLTNIINMCRNCWTLFAERRPKKSEDTRSVDRRVRPSSARRAAARRSTSATATLRTGAYRRRGGKRQTTSQRPCRAADSTLRHVDTLSCSKGYATA